MSTKLFRPFLVLGLFFLSLSAFSQRSLRSYELAGFAGSSTMAGNFASNNSLNTALAEASMQAGVGFTYFHGPRFGWGTEARLGRVFADNANHQNVGYTGIQAQSDYVQLQAQGTLNLVKYGKYYKRNSHTPYIRPGVGILFSQSKYMEDIPYPSSATVHPGTNPSLTYGMEIGWKFRLSEYQTFSVEYSWNSVPGDRLEGFSIPDDTTPDQLTGLRFRYAYAIYTWQ